MAEHLICPPNQPMNPDEKLRGGKNIAKGPWATRVPEGWKSVQ